MVEMLKLAIQKQARCIFDLIEIRLGEHVWTDFFFIFVYILYYTTL